MNQMNAIAWLFPIIFMLHDFEEIVFIKVWRERYKAYLDKCKMKKKPYEDFRSADEFSIGVEIIFFIASLTALFSIISNNYYIWYGLFLAFTAHFIVAHLNLVIKFKHYVPGIVTATIFFPLNIYILYKAAIILKFSLNKIVISCVISGIFAFLLFTVLKSTEKHFANLLAKFSNTVR